MHSKPDSNLVILHKGRGQSASLSEAYEPCCKPRATLGAYVALVAALLTYGAIAYFAGWL